MTDNIAILDGFTQEVWGSTPYGEYEGLFLIKPDSDLDSVVKAWDMDNQEYLRLNGWLWDFEKVKDHGHASQV